MLRNLTNLMFLTLMQVDMVEFEPIKSISNVSSSLEFSQFVSCKLRGEFPESFFRLPKLETVNLDDNPDLIVSFPSRNWTADQLKYLTLSKITLSTDISYLAKGAKSLSVLSLLSCFSIGSYLTLLANLTLLPNLTVLVLSHNNFTGRLPEFWGDNNSSKTLVPMKLKTLDLSFNLFSGPIPSSLLSLPLLETLKLQNNQFDGLFKEVGSRVLSYVELSMNRLSGHIPSSIYEQEKLFYLDLSSNKFGGLLELNKFRSKNLAYLRFSSNSFSLSPESYTNDISFTTINGVLDLSSCNVIAFPNFLGSLKALQVLELSDNQIQGEIPKWLWGDGGSYSLTYLDLSKNFLTRMDRIPWDTLVTLNVRSNLIQGTIPNLLPPSLVNLFASNNRLTGAIPNCLCCNSSNLNILDLSNNSLRGNIPLCLANQLRLLVLDLKMNDFDGFIPDIFANTTELRSFHLNGNRLEGQLPRSLRNCRNLEVLDVGNNKMSDSFPNWLENLPSLKVLILRSNRFHGTIRPDTSLKFPFQSLRIIDLSDNIFEGLLPTKYFQSFVAMMDDRKRTDEKLTYIGQSYYQDSVTITMKDSVLVLEKILTILTTIDLSGNNFEGMIPGPTLGKLKSLKGLNFSWNGLTGPVPVFLGNLTNLEWLDLSSNKLVGNIPWKLTDLTMLQSLNLFRNRLEGPIPTGKQFNTFGNDSYSNNLGLCGFPLSKPCNDDESPCDHDQRSENETGSVLDPKFVMMGYATGLVIGLSIGYMVLFSQGFNHWLVEKVGEARLRKMIARFRVRKRIVRSA